MTSQNSYSNVIAVDGSEAQLRDVRIALPEYRITQDMLPDMLRRAVTVGA